MSNAPPAPEIQQQADVLVPPPSKVTVTLDIEDGDTLGVTPNAQLIVTKVQKGSIGEEKLQVGDQIISINGTTLKDTNHFYKQWRYAPPKATIVLVRDIAKSNEILEKTHIPEAREKNILRREGCEYFIARLVFEKGRKMGLGLKAYQNRVLVAKIEENSIASNSLMVGDHLCDVDGIRITDQDVCKKMLIDHLKLNLKASFLIERPISADAKIWAKKALLVKIEEPPSVRLASDVTDIASRERAKIKSCSIPKKSCYSKTETPSATSVTFGQSVSDIHIVSDNEGVALRKAKK
uniref:PDZ domain-containing protein n=1 Tax=Rhabditophanes sp. KR3021 TaxID=114890 RepID=A0AC35TNV6_9BILA